MALMGTETLRQLVLMSLQLAGRQYSIGSSNNSFTGIGGTPEPSQGLVDLPLGLGLPEVYELRIDMDLLGGEGSSCPGLLPLHLLVQWRSAILNGALPHDDGILILQLEHKHRGWTTYFLHLFMTDSGHYLCRPTVS